MGTARRTLRGPSDDTLVGPPAHPRVRHDQAPKTGKMRKSIGFDTIEEAIAAGVAHDSFLCRGRRSFCKQLQMSGPVPIVAEQKPLIVFHDMRVAGFLDLFVQVTISNGRRSNFIYLQLVASKP